MLRSKVRREWGRVSGFARQMRRLPRETGAQAEHVAELERRLQDLEEGLRSSQAALQDALAARTTAEAEVARRFDAMQAELAVRSPLIWNEVRQSTLPAEGLITRWLGATGDGGVEAMTAAVRKAGFAPWQEELVLELGPSTLLRWAEADRVPVPASGDREGYLGEDHVNYWLMGAADRLMIESIAAKRDRPLADGARILDFGGATGRVLRHFLHDAPALDLHSVDITTHNVVWSREHLPGVSVGLSTVVPALPYPDAFFDVIYAGSVFTHIDGFEETTLLELLRVLRPGGVAILTFH